MKHRFSKSVGLALAFILAGGLVFVGYQALEAKGRPLPSWEVEIISDESSNVVGESDDGTAVFDGYKGDDDELVWVGKIDNTLCLAFQYDPENHFISFPGLVFDPDTADINAPYCGFPVDDCGASALECLSCFMSKDHTLPDYNLYIRVYAMEDIAVGETGTGGVLIELIGHDTGGTTVHDVECRADPNVTGSTVDIWRMDDKRWSTSTTGAVLECKEQYWDITQHPKNKNKWIYEKKVSVTALTDFTFGAIWTETK